MVHYIPWMEMATIVLFWHEHEQLKFRNWICIINEPASAVRYRRSIT